jgi:hypothetical protein
MGWATFWVISSHTHLVTLDMIWRDGSSKISRLGGTEKAFNTSKTLGHLRTKKERLSGFCSMYVFIARQSSAIRGFLQPSIL